MYCTETEFARYAPNAQRWVEPMRRVVGWIVTSTASLYQARPDGPVAALFKSGKELSAAQSSLSVVDAADEWYYDEDTGTLYYYNASVSPNTLNMEAGEDREVFINWLLGEASGHIDAMLDGRFQTPFMPDSTNKYDSVIIRATAYMAAYIVMLDKTDDAEVYGNRLANLDGNGIIDMLNDGKLKLRIEVDTESARGEITVIGTSFDQINLAFEVVENHFEALENIGSMQIVETRGEASGVSWDDVMVQIITGGSIGAATYSTYGYDAGNDSLQTYKIVNAKIIDGRFQNLAYGLQIRFAGGSAIAGDSWSVVVRGAGERVTHGIDSFQAVRG